MKESLQSSLLGKLSLAIHNSEAESSNKNSKTSPKPNSKSTKKKSIDLKSTPSSRTKKEEQVPAETENSKKPKREPKLWFTSLWLKLTSHHPKKLLVGSLVSLVLIAFFLIPNLLYKSKILPKTSLGGSNSSLSLSSNPEVAKEQIKSVSDEFKFQLVKDEQEQSFTPQELGFTPDIDKTLSGAKQSSDKLRFYQKPFALLFSSRQVPLEYSFDESKLKEFLKTNYADGTPAEDAQIIYDEASSTFVIKPEVEGLGIDSTDLTAKLKPILSSIDDQKLELKISQTKAQILTENIQAEVQTANEYISQKLQVQTPDKNYTPTKSQLKDFLVFAPVPADSKYDLSLNQESINSYISSLVGRTNRKVENRLVANLDGTELLLNNGTAGRSVNNQTSAQKELAQAFNSRSGGTVTLTVDIQNPTTDRVTASGGRWIYADISQFKVYAYEGANLVNSFSMSSGAPETPTPPGNYSVLRKVRVQTMRGGRPGTPDYYSVPNIEWVAYFRSGGYAMHGVYWHNNFGVKNTSHGCMGMRNSDAKWVYDFIDIGTPVIVVA